MKDDRTKMTLAKVAPNKGVVSYAVEIVKRFIELLGYKNIMFRSDNEPAILALKDAVRKESDVEIILEEAPVGDHRANGLVENALKHVQGQFRVLKDALESRHGRRLEGGHQAVPWLVMHAASVISRGRKYEQGFSAYRRWKRREFNKPVAEFGECVLYAPVMSVGRNKVDTRWNE